MSEESSNNRPCDAGDGYAGCKIINDECVQCGRKFSTLETDAGKEDKTIQLEREVTKLKRDLKNLDLSYDALNADAYELRYQRDELLKTVAERDAYIARLEDKIGKLEAESILNGIKSKTDK